MLLCVVRLANAGIDLGTDRVRLSGFATLGVTRGGNETLGFQRDLERKGVFNGNWTLQTDSLLGLQLDADLTDALSATVQMVYKDRPKASLKDYLDWAFLRYRFGPDWTVRVGRMGIDLFMLSDYREVGFSYLWARPPVEYYTVLAFNHFDGADVAYSTPAGVGTFTAKMFAGQIDNTFNAFGNTLQFKFKPVVGGTFGWETENWQTRFSISSLKTDLSEDYLSGTLGLVQGLQNASLFWPQATDYLQLINMKNKRFLYYSLGAAYDNRPWVVQSEVDYVDSTSDLMRTFAGGYFSLGYRIGPTTVYGMLAKVKNLKSRQTISPPPSIPGNPVLDAQLALLQQSTQTLVDGPNFNQQTASVGMRWDIRYDLALKVQWDHTWVNAYGSGLWDQREILTQDKSLNTFSINLNGVF